MDKEQIKGVAQTIKGKIEKTVGHLTGNKDVEVEGKIDEATGKVRQAIGKGKDAVRDALKDGQK